MTSPNPNSATAVVAAAAPNLISPKTPPIEGRRQVVLADPCWGTRLLGDDSKIVLEFRDGRLRLPPPPVQARAGEPSGRRRGATDLRCPRSPPEDRPT
jgi:hypothetical protein